MEFKLAHLVLVSLVLLPFVASVNYSQNGKNWSGTCSSGQKQSPINIQSASTKQNSYIKFVVNYLAFEDQTLNVTDNGNKIYLTKNETKAVGSSIDLWNERGEHYLFYFDYMQWKTKSEHTLDNRQYSAELQIYHKQYATNKQLVISILFDEEIFLSGQKIKACFVESFKFKEHLTRNGSLEIPMREYLQYIPQDFYYYYGSKTEPTCDEVTTWIIMKAPQAITTTQLNKLKSIVNSTTGNSRNIQNIGTRTVYLSGAQLGYILVSANALKFEYSACGLLLSLMAMMLVY